MVKCSLFNGAIAQLGERLPCTQEVSGSIPLSSTKLSMFFNNTTKRKNQTLLKQWLCDEAVGLVAYEVLYKRKIECVFIGVYACCVSAVG